MSRCADGEGVDKSWTNPDLAISCSLSRGRNSEQKDAMITNTKSSLSRIPLHGVLPVYIGARPAEGLFFGVWS